MMERFKGGGGYQRTGSWNSQGRNWSRREWGWQWSWMWGRGRHGWCFEGGRRGPCDMIVFGLELKGEGWGLPPVSSPEGRGVMGSWSGVLSATCWWKFWPGECGWRDMTSGRGGVFCWYQGQNVYPWGRCGRCCQNCIQVEKSEDWAETRVSGEKVIGEFDLTCFCAVAGATVVGWFWKSFSLKNDINDLQNKTQKERETRGGAESLHSLWLMYLRCLYMKTRCMFVSESPRWLSQNSGRGSMWAAPWSWSPVHIERQRGTFPWFMLSSVKIHSLSACVCARRAHDM